ncbi:4412_t:CDS:1, partial [Funneliformis geosporum]
TKKTDHADSFDNITKHDNMVLFTTPPYIKNSGGSDVLLGLLQQTPN